MKPVNLVGFKIDSRERNCIMEHNYLKKGTIIRTVFVTLELIVLVIISIIAFSNDGASVWGYWGTVAAILITLSPIFIYVIASAVFNVCNLVIVLKKQHTAETVKKYCKTSKSYFVWGIVTGALYGGWLIPIFLLENIFLFKGYKKELERIKNTQSSSQA